MRKLVVLLLGSFMLCVATFTGVHASSPIPDRKVHATEYVMYAPTMATCTIDTVATTHAAVLEPALGPVAPDSLVTVDGGNEYLALLRSMTCPPERRHKQGEEAGSNGAGPPSPEKEMIYGPAPWRALLSPWLALLPQIMAYKQALYRIG